MPLTTFLNGGTAVQLRGLAWLSMSEHGQIGRGTFLSDGGGGGSSVWSYGGTIPCRIDSFGSGGMDETLVANRVDDRSTHVITVPAGTDVTHTDRFQILGQGAFEVSVVRDRTAEWVTHLEAVKIT